MVSVSISADGAGATVRLDASEGAEKLDAAAVSRLIADLADVRAKMRPTFSGRFNPGVTPAIECDNLMWESHPDSSRRGINLGFQHAGLGWLRLRLSRAQAEDLITSIQFAVVDLLHLPGWQGLRTPPDPEPKPQAPNESRSPLWLVGR